MLWRGVAIIDAVIVVVCCLLLLLLSLFVAIVDVVARPIAGGMPSQVVSVRNGHRNRPRRASWLDYHIIPPPIPSFIYSFVVPPKMQI